MASAGIWLEGNYILYNECAKETDPGEVLDEFGQREFDLTRKYMDCGRVY